MHQAIHRRLTSPKDAFTSYVDLINWIVENYIPNGINYHTVNKYVKRHFGAKLKVSRKSHIKKDENAVDTFKNFRLILEETFKNTPETFTKYNIYVQDESRFGYLPETEKL